MPGVGWRTLPVRFLVSRHGSRSGRIDPSRSGVDYLGWAMKDIERQRYRALLRRGFWFGRLPEQLQDAILERSAVRSYPRGSMIAVQDSPPEALFAVLEGQVAIGRWATPDEEVLIYIGSRGMWFGEIALLLSTKINASKTVVEAAAHTDAQVLALPKTAYDELIENDPENYRWFALLALERYSGSLRSETESRVFTATELLMARLADLAALRQRDYGKKDNVVALQMTQADIAALTGISRQTVNIVLHQLEKEGLVELALRNIRIPSIARLRGQLEAVRLDRAESAADPWAAAFR